MNYTELASKEVITKTTEALKAHNFMPEVLATKEEALAKIKELIPEGASVMNGASRTLEQIGYIEHLKAKQHGWSNIHDTILEETDEAKKAELRKMGVLSDFYLGSVHAVTQNGELFIASNTGSQLPHLAFTSPNLILIVSTQKIVPTLTEAFDRLEKHVIPLEDERMMGAYGYGSQHNKTLILHGENPAMGRKVHVLLIEEALGF
jgi:L-lactate utilization protein LutC